VTASSGRSPGLEDEPGCRSIEVAAERSGVDWRRASEDGGDSFGTYEPAAPQRNEFSDRHAGTRDDERLAALHLAPDVVSFVAEPSLVISRAIYQCSQVIAPRLRGFAPSF
jgi:hypothetical protein